MVMEVAATTFLLPPDNAFLFRLLPCVDCDRALASSSDLYPLLMDSLAFRFVPGLDAMVIRNEEKDLVKSM